MSDPADKSDDLIAELAKLMASSPGNGAGGVQPVTRPAPLNPTATTPLQPAAPAPVAQQPTPIRIPGMDAPLPPRPMATPPQQPQPEPRAPLTGSIRIPGMDQPAPVSTTAPVGKFDFGGKPAVAPIKQEPLSSFTERLQGGRNLANDGAPKVEAPPAPIRIPSDLKPVSENKSFAESPSLGVGRLSPAPAVPPVAPVQQQPAPSDGDFHFDFGLTANPQPTPVPVAQQPRPAPQPAAPAEDPIAALIEADLADGEQDGETDEPDFADEPEPQPQPVRPAAMVTPMIRPVGPQGPKVQMAPASQAPQRPQGAAPIPLKPVSVAPRSPETDRFAISPGVGLNMKPPATQPLSPQPRAPEPVSSYDDSDPMSEIESLIGEAVRVELTPGPVRVQTPQQVAPRVQFEPEAELEREITRRPEPAPVVPPLTTAFAPRRANLKDDKNAASAEDAILAAAAASGAEVGRIEPAVGDESPYRRLKVKPQRSSFLSGGMRQYVGMAVAGTLLLAAGLGLYWVLNMGRTSSATSSNAPLLTADTTPVKVKPAATPTPTTDTAKSPVLAKMDGTSSAPSQEQLVSTDETNGGGVTRDVTPATTDDDNESGLANRKVRTVTVRPDGTIVSGDTALAGGEALPIDRPNVPAVPSTETTNLLDNGGDSQTASIPTVDTSATDTTATGATTQVAETAPVIDPNAVAPTPMTFPVRTSSAPLALTTPPRNTNVNAVTDTGTTDLLGDSQDPQVAAVTPPKKTPAPAAASSGSVAAYVQLSSQPTQADAQAAIKTMTAKYGSLFGGNSLTIQQVDLGQKGVRWRVRLPAASLSDASNICAQIKAQGGDCFPTKS